MKVFISSTSEDLEPYRAAAAEVVRDQGDDWKPIMMEHFGAHPRKGIVDFCQSKVRECDLVVAIVAWRRGGVPGPEAGGDGRESYMARELEAAGAQPPIDVLTFLADERWPEKLWERHGDALAWVENFRNTLDRVAVSFAWEEDEKLPAFSARVREALVGYREGRMAQRPPPPPEPRRLVPWTFPDYPADPYPLLLPYTHPDLFAGRGRELDEIERRLALPAPILGLYSVSGAGKSSLLQAGVVPRLAQAGTPVVLDRDPHEPGLAARLLGDLLENGAGEDPDGSRFVEEVRQARDLAGRPPVLILDQFEEVLLLDRRDPQRAAVGALLAATVQRQPGLGAAPLCRWVLVYRSEYHGRLEGWLEDAAADAREAELPGAASLPRDLSGVDRFQSLELKPLGAPPPGAERRAAAEKAFRGAIEAPLAARAEDGSRCYPWSFAADGAGRLASAFAEARLAQEEAPLVPELQVVLERLLAEAEERESNRLVVPADVQELVDRALDGHLRRQLDRALPAGRGAGLHRTRVLMALRRLSTAEGRRGAGLSEADLTTALDPGGAAILRRLAGERARILVQRPDGETWALSHDRMAEVVTRLVDEEGARATSAERRVLEMRPVVEFKSALFARGNRRESLALSRRQHAGISEHRAALLWSEQERRWWERADKSWRRRRRTLGATGIGVGLVLVLLFWQGWRTEYLSRLRSTPESSVHALLQRNRPVGPRTVSRVLWSRGDNLDLLEHAWSRDAPLPERSARVLAVVGGVQPLPQFAPDSPLGNEFLGTSFWMLDYLDGEWSRLGKEDRAAQVAAARRRLRESMWARVPPRQDLEACTADEKEFREIPGGEYRMGSRPDPSEPDLRPLVSVGSFRLQAHEVTLGEYRRFVPDHPVPDWPNMEGIDAADLPVVAVSWWDAYAYSAWLGGRLPTEVEWEYAARSGGQERDHPWAAEEPADCDHAVIESEHGLGCGEGRPWPVCSRRAGDSDQEVCDLAGNVWEWVGDWFGEVPDDGAINPWGPPRGVDRVIRGGSFWLDTMYARSAIRDGRVPRNEVVYLGFRVLLPAPSDRG